jgi:hypothetical protein
VKTNRRRFAILDASMSAAEVRKPVREPPGADLRGADLMSNGDE